jgi:ammonium transporter, Amt family
VELQITELRYALDTFYLLISGALVMWMAAGFAMLEAGLVRSRNTVEILTKNFAAYGIACVMYLFIGYHLMYSSPAGGWLPDFGFLIGAEHENLNGDSPPVYARLADFFFQVVFVATAMSIISGAIAERMKLSAFLLFGIIMTGFIYPLGGYWVWGGGFLQEMGFSDFAGAGVVHLAGATAALCGVLFLGPRRGKYTHDGRVNALPGANLPMSALGALILWMGWFGFNGGSELRISGFDQANSVALVFVNTNMAAVGGMLMAMIMARTLFGKADLTMIINGSLAGLVAITAGPAAPTPVVALTIGAVAGVLVVFSVITLDKYKIDDPVGAISVHGVVGIWGLMAVPLSNPATSFLKQFTGTLVIAAWVFAISLLVWFILDKLIGLRVSQEDEYQGLDIAECGVEAYPEFSHKS